MNTIRTCLLAIVFCCVLYQVFAQGKQCFHETFQKQGKCVNLKQCPSAIERLKKGEYPQKCGFEGRSSIVCCVDEHPQNRQRKLQIGEISIRKCNEYGEIARKLKTWCNLPLPTPISNDNGLHVAPGEFPHMVALGYESKNGSIVYFCAGSLISENYVITSAYCTNLPKFKEPVTVRLGDVSLKSQTGDSHAKSIDIAKIIKHPSYKPPNVYDDLALIELKTPVNFTDHVYPACLGTKEGGHEDVFALSWGERSGWPDKLQIKIKLEIYPHKKCSTFFELDDHVLENGVSNKTQICAGVSSSSKYLCRVVNDDSGGPLVAMSETNCMYSLIGVTAIGDACVLEKRPRVYSKISHYVEWIENIVWL